jgi:selenium-binding protein 1
MTLMRPDPTFYPSLSMAMQAPEERLAYVALLNAGQNGQRDAMGVIDLAIYFWAVALKSLSSRRK